MVGDFGWTFNMTNTQLDFDGINAYVGNLTAKGGKINFFMTMGDNMYIENEEYPTDADVDTMMSPFQKPHIKDLLIYAIRGNHDCTTKDPYFQVNITKRYPTWRMPELYYARTFDIGNGKKLGSLFVDTCLALCSNFSYSNGTGGQLLSENPFFAESEMSPEMQRLKFGIINCTDPTTVAMGNDLYHWINSTLKEWSKDPSIVWKQSVQHHPMFSKHWSDYANITANLLPMLMDYKVDFYLNGHEHATSYAYYPYSQAKSLLREVHTPYALEGFSCAQD